MILLALDTAGADCAVALYDSERDNLLSCVSETIGRGHAERLMGMVDAALDTAGLTLEHVGRVAVTVGPGSFTGIRVGLAAARGLALGLGVECVGIGTLPVLAADWRKRHGRGPVLAAMDAKRGEVYAQCFDAAGHPFADPGLLSLDDFLRLAGDWQGAIAGSGRALMGEEPMPDHFPIAEVARLGAAAPYSGKPKPLYLRGPDAKPQTGFAVERVGDHA
ncbi:tRNA (adenosine(37)-N6)-threonylcarbamoyltransferase complex dimerization subunit type 1 TsaB [Allorhizobium sp. BGMRC 0089]|uniref:tRNA (adenosine(37)-N6)-threonylcarbamoyltransferase complex dimerization subunit type 1 TsaB n=1 Tax=Allorhizobium sonneratiae TaxID=2934936 RepID=UPI002033E355|nr:tRNA (adenosine(37)-N6)-threonylcarbamoyltransferase complex dimerization subunit type 1 TsaB [Allorhizobium sonneratiae]MCM2291561.1 tRNA (adenosine(37)-N6)-threonylcarbamoyltransferase complex dimerization subunit type 1 TsaB [Allorhizobium sonneratiae]